MTSTDCEYRQTDLTNLKKPCKFRPQPKGRGPDGPAAPEEDSKRLTMEYAFCTSKRLAMEDARDFIDHRHTARQPFRQFRKERHRHRLSIVYNSVRHYTFSTAYSLFIHRHLNPLQISIIVWALLEKVPFPQTPPDRRRGRRRHKLKRERPTNS